MFVKAATKSRPGTQRTVIVHLTNIFSKQLLAHNQSRWGTPSIITDMTPVSTDAHFHTSFIVCVSSNQTNITMAACWCYTTNNTSTAAWQCDLNYFDTFDYHNFAVTLMPLLPNKWETSTMLCKLLIALSTWCLNIHRYLYIIGYILLAIFYGSSLYLLMHKFDDDLQLVHLLPRDPKCEIKYMQAIALQIIMIYWLHCEHDATQFHIVLYVAIL